MSLIRTVEKCHVYIIDKIILSPIAHSFSEKIYKI